MKTFNEFSEEIDEVMGFSARKAVGRRMKMMAKKASTKMKKARNKMKALSLDKAKVKAQKAVRNLIKQKTVGKSKDLGTMSIGQKLALDKKVDKKMKSMGGKVHALVGKFSKKIIKKHRAAAAAARSKK
jgi:superfamily II DNA or RNA helicase